MNLVEMELLFILENLIGQDLYEYSFLSYYRRKCVPILHVPTGTDFDEEERACLITAFLSLAEIPGLGR